MQELGLPTLVYRRLRGDMIECYKPTNNIYDEKVSKILTQYSEIVDNPGRTRGHNKKLYVKKAKKVIGSKSFAYRSNDIWNNLPEKLVNAPSLIASKMG